MSLARPEQIDYPTSDGRPLGETDVHRQQIFDLIAALEYYYRDRDDIYVSGNLLMFYEEGDRHKHRSPDVLVTHGIPRRQRDNYKIWEEGKAPDLIFEVTSLSTRTEDLGEKKGLYCLLGVQEYVIFDPLREYLQPSLRLYRRSGEEYLPVAGHALQTVGLNMELLDSQLRLRVAATGELLPTVRELGERARRAEQESRRAEQESRRADTAEAELARLRAELERLKGK